MQRIFQLSAWILALAILVLSIVPPEYRPVTDAPHDLEHLIIFLLTGVAFGVGYPYRHDLLAFALIAYAGAIEIAQIWVPGRHSRLSDFIVDGMSAFIGVGITWLYKKIRSRGSPHLPAGE